MDVIPAPRTECRKSDQPMKTSWIRFAVLAIVLLSRAIFAAEEWPGVPFVEVRAYAWPLENEKGDRKVILAGMRLREDVINPEGAVLSADQVKRLQAAVTGEHAEHALIRCYDPHNAFVFYDADKKPVAFVEVCFRCVGAAAVPPGTARWKDFPALAKIFAELKLPIGGGQTLENFNKFFDSVKKAR
jgi:hypothetical protein